MTKTGNSGEGKTPLKRHESLTAFSRDHHHGLLLGWKIRTGFKKGISPERIKAYCDYFYQGYLLPHFVLEEKHVFPLLGEESELVQRAVKEHRRLTQLFQQQEDLPAALTFIEQELEQHIRFEERVLFQELQRVASDYQLQRVEAIHTGAPEESWDDVFWK